MKKIIYTLVIMFFMFSLVGCLNKTKEPDNSNDNNQNDKDLNGPDTTDPYGEYDSSNLYSLYPYYTTQEYGDSKFNVLYGMPGVVGDELINYYKIPTIISLDNIECESLKELFNSHLSDQELKDNYKALWFIREEPISTDILEDIEYKELFIENKRVFVTVNYKSQGVGGEAFSYYEDLILIPNEWEEKIGKHEIKLNLQNHPYGYTYKIMSYKLMNEFKETYREEKVNKEFDDQKYREVYILDTYGEYNGCLVVTATYDDYVHTDEELILVETFEDHKGYSFGILYDGHYPIIVYKDHKIYTLTQAYLNGYLTIDDLYIIYKNAQHFIFTDDNDAMFNLDIQNETENELVGIKNEYHFLEEVEVKMEYDMAVEICVYLDGMLIGLLNGSNSVKFNMPKKDSVLTISYYEGTIYKLNVIDNFGLIEEDLNGYYAPEEIIVFHVSHELYDNIVVTINGKVEEGIDPLIETRNFKTYSFRMPEEECEIKVTINWLSDYSCNDNLHHYEKEIKKVDNSYILESTCKLCGEIVKEEITKIKLDTTILYFGSYSNDDSFESFVKTYNLSNRRYLIIDNVETYYEIYPNIPRMNKELLSEEEANEFFKNNMIVIHIRYISGTLDFVPVNYYYNTVVNNIIMEYANDVPDCYTTQFLGNTLDIITIPKEYYNEIMEDLLTKVDGVSIDYNKLLITVESTYEDIVYSYLDEMEINIDVFLPINWEHSDGTESLILISFETDDYWNLIEEIKQIEYIKKVSMLRYWYHPDTTYEVIDTKDIY